MSSENEADVRFVKFLSKQVRLSHSIRQYISGLKAEGKSELAYSLARKAKEKEFVRRVKTLDEELAKSVVNIIESEDPDVKDQFRIIWILVKKKKMSLAEAGYQITDLLVRRPSYEQETYRDISAEIRQDVDFLKEDLEESGI